MGVTSGEGFITRLVRSSALPGTMPNNVRPVGSDFSSDVELNEQEKVTMTGIPSQVQAETNSPTPV